MKSMSHKAKKMKLPFEGIKWRVRLTESQYVKEEKKKERETYDNNKKLK